MIGTFRVWLHTWWLNVPEPREVSAVFTVAYMITLYTGIVTLLSPPDSLSQVVGGKAVMASVGALLILGSLISMYGGARDFWRLERIGIWLMAWGIGIYFAIVAYLQSTTPGSRLTQLGMIALGGCVLLLRYVLIRWFTYRPRG